MFARDTAFGKKTVMEHTRRLELKPLELVLVWERHLRY